MQKLTVVENNSTRLILSTDLSARKAQTISYGIFLLILVSFAVLIYFFANNIFTILLLASVILIALLVLKKLVSIITTTVILRFNGETRQITHTTTFWGRRLKHIEWAFDDVAEIQICWGGQRDSQEFEKDWILGISKITWANQTAKNAGTVIDSSDTKKMAELRAEIEANNMQVCEGQSHAETLVLAKRLALLIAKPIWDELNLK